MMMVLERIRLNYDDDPVRNIMCSVFVRFHGSFVDCTHFNWLCTMKHFILLLMFIIPVTMTAAEAQLEMKVSGNCKMCKKTIEKAANKVDGVIEVNWDVKSKVFTAKYDDEKTNQEEITNAILDNGYDVENMIADDNAYEELAKCCRYRDQDCD